MLLPLLVSTSRSTHTTLDSKRQPASYRAYVQILQNSKVEAGSLTSHKTSAVWLYLDFENENKVVCRLCQSKLAYNHLTKAMRNHTQHRHVNVNLQDILNVRLYIT